jgi:hypothetical protein
MMSEAQIRRILAGEVARIERGKAEGWTSEVISFHHGMRRACETILGERAPAHLDAADVIERQVDAIQRLEARS